MILKTLAFNRKSLLKIMEQLTQEQLCVIPKGFKNNIIWNIGHILVTEQLLSYKLSENTMKIEEKFITHYGKGSAPKTSITTQELEEIKTQLFPAYLQTQKDYEKALFNHFTDYPTSTGIILKNIDQARQFNVFHEGIHLGIVLSIKKLVD